MILEDMRRLKLKAQAFVLEQVRLKNLPRAATLTCIDCGASARDYDHYKGYSRKHWLSIQPVCRSCHVKRGHKRNPNWAIHISQSMSKTCPHNISPKNTCKTCVNKREALYRIWRIVDHDFD